MAAMSSMSGIIRVRSAKKSWLLAHFSVSIITIYRNQIIEASRRFTAAGPINVARKSEG